MRVTLLGFSGIGKSHLASRLKSQRNWQAICCDDRIEERLRLRNDFGNKNGIEGVADWLGEPFEEKFLERQDAYLESEIQVMRGILEDIKSGNISDDCPLVVDASGSLVYCGEKICEDLKQHTIMVYLELSASDRAVMFEEYLNNPKPVIWKNLYRPRAGEDYHLALKRCFPELIHDRERLYKKYAHVTLSVNLKTRAALETDNFLRLLENL